MRQHMSDVSPGGIDLLLCLGVNSVSWISNALDLVVGIITCCCIPGTPAFLVNVENL